MLTSFVASLKIYTLLQLLALNVNGVALTKIVFKVNTLWNFSWLIILKLSLYNTACNDGKFVISFKPLTLAISVTSLVLGLVIIPPYTLGKQPYQTCTLTSIFPSHARIDI